MALDTVLFVPSGNPPLKSAHLADALDRFLMTQQAIAGNPFFAISDCELSGDRKSFTVDTVKVLLERHSGDTLSLILGIDAFLDLPNWFRPDELVALVDLVVASRPGIPANRLETSPFIEGRKPGAGGRWRVRGGKTLHFLDILALDISSTRIRELVRSGASIRYLLPDSVAEMIDSKNLYRI